MITGAGGVAFCAGADLKAIESFGPRMDDPRGPLGISRVISSKPTIAAISGWCLAGGLELALWCDLRIATGESRLGFPERRWGVPLVDGGTQRLPRIVGLGRALDLILTGRIIDAEEAHSIGLLTEIVPAGRHLERALELAEALARFPQDTMLADRLAAIEGVGLTFARGPADGGPQRACPRARPPGAERRASRPARAAEVRASSLGCQCPRSRSPTCASRTARSRPCAGSPFNVERGEVFGLLGPNGAGKTTTVEILEGYRRRSSGDVRVLGRDPQEPRPRATTERGHRPPELRLLPARDRARGARALRKPYANRRDARETIELVGLAEKADTKAKNLSGGQRRRLDLALALVGDPELVFLDEPTTGFDPAARRVRLGRHRKAQAARQDGPPDHALPRRGAGARRPSRDRQGRRDRRGGCPRRPERRQRALPHLLHRGRRPPHRARHRRPDPACCTN